MTMDNSSKVLIILASIAVIAGVGVCYEMGNDSVQADDASIVGHWYQIAFFGYTDGTYTASDTETADSRSLWDFSVLSYDSTTHTVTALYRGNAVNGTYSNNYLSFCTASGDETQWLNLYVHGGMMYGVNSGKSDTADGQKEYYVVYSANRNATATNPTLFDLTGSWKTDLACVLDANGTSSEPAGTTLTVTEQRGMVGRGTVDLDGGGTAVSCEFFFALTPNTVDGYQQGFMVCEGNNWNFLAKDGRLILVTVDSNETNGTYAVERCYTPDGRTGDGLSVPTLTEKAWTYAGYNISYAGILNISYYESMSLNIENQYGPIFWGTFVSQSHTYNVSGYCYGEGQAMIGFITSGVEDNYFSGLIADHQLELTQWSNDNTNSSAIISLTNEAGPSDPTGYWNVSRCSMISADGSTSMLDGLNLDIFKVQDGIFWGRYGITYVSGTYTDGTLCFCTKLSDGTQESFVGYFAGAQTLISNEVRYTSDGQCIAVISFFTDRLLLGTSLSTAASSLVGTWTAPDGYCYTFAAGQKTAVLGTKITVSQHSYSSAFVYGTMEQEVTGLLTTKTFTGVLDNFNSGSTDRATVVDETGLIYHLTTADGVLYVSSVCVSDTGTLERVACQRTYTKDGSTPVLPTYQKLTDTTWQTGGCTAIAADGTRVSLSGCILKIDNQYQNVFSGTVTISGHEYALVGYLDPTGATSEACVSFIDDIAFQSDRAIFTTGSLTLYGHSDTAGNALAYIITLRER